MRIESLGYRTDVMVRRVSGSLVDEHSDCIVVRTPSIPGFRWGNFLLMPAAPSLADVEQWESWFAAEFPDARHRAFGLDTTDGKTGDPAALTALGATSRVNAVMSAGALREPDRPDLELRAFDDAAWAQLATLRSTVYPSPEDGPAKVAADAAFVAQQVVATKELVARGHDEWLGTFDQGLLVAALGIVSDGSGPARYQAVETHPDCRRRGLARRLVYDAAVLAHDRFRTRELMIVADPDLHAITLYESLGFTTVEQQVEVMRTPADTE